MLTLPPALDTFSSTKAGARVLEVEKVREIWAIYCASGSFDYAPLNAVALRKSSRRSAQDDDFVVVLEESRID
jgi:hypothetical protein